MSRFERRGDCFHASQHCRDTGQNLDPSAVQAQFLRQSAETRTTADNLFEPRAFYKSIQPGVALSVTRMNELTSAQLALHASSKIPAAGTGFGSIAVKEDCVELDFILNFWNDPEI